MTSSKQGFRFEHDVSNTIHKQTDSEIRSYRCGYSGNNLAPTPDILLTTPSENYACELKKTSQDKGFCIEADDIQQLYDCSNDYTECWFAVKFTHRELLMFDFRWVETQDCLADALESQIPLAFKPRVGKKSGNLLLDKPSLDDWSSSTSGRSDVDVLLSTLGIDVGTGSKTPFDISEANA